MDKDSDIIGNLPGHIQDKILSHLPIRDAIRTSILSRKWRYKWAAIPHLVFDSQGEPISSRDRLLLPNRIVNIVDHVLLLHDGPIHKFKISHRDLPSVSDIDRWILHLSRRAIKEFVLEVWKGQRYRLPSSLFACQTLVHLELFNCHLNPPPTFTGFKSLKTLDLQWVTIPQNAFENLIPSCPLLERLTILNFDGFSDLKIDSRSLKFLQVGGSFKDLNFVNTLSLFEVSIGMYTSFGDYRNWTLRSSNLCIFFINLPQVERLDVRGYFLKHLAADFIPDILLVHNAHLNYLSVHINFRDMDEILASLCVLRSSPNLQKFEVLVRSDELPTPGTASNFRELDMLNCTFSHLQLVNIAGVSGLKSEMDFINLLLLASPDLKKMTIEPALNCEVKTLMKELLRCRRSSEHAEIVFID